MHERGADDMAGQPVTTTALTVRLPVGLHRQLTTVAVVDGRSAGEVIRLALTAYIEHRQDDPAFQDRLNAYLADTSRLATERSST